MPRSLTDGSEAANGARKSSIISYSLLTIYVYLQYYFTDAACDYAGSDKIPHPDLGNDSRSLSVQVENGTFVFPARAKVPDARMQTWRNKMRKLVSTLAGSAVLALGLALAAPAAPAAMIVPAAAAAVTPATQMVEKVEHRRWHRGGAAGIEPTAVGTVVNAVGIDAITVAIFTADRHLSSFRHSRSAGLRTSSAAPLSRRSVACPHPLV